MKRYYLKSIYSFIFLLYTLQLKRSKSKESDNGNYSKVPSSSKIFRFQPRTIITTTTSQNKDKHHRVFSVNTTSQNSNKKKYIKTVKSLRCLSTSNSPKHKNDTRSSSNAKKEKISVNTVKKKNTNIFSNQKKQNNVNKNYITINNDNQSSKKQTKLKSIIQLYSQTERKTYINLISNRHSGNKKDFSLSSKQKKEKRANSNIKTNTPPLSSIIIKLKSNWGNPYHIGLGKLKLFTKNKTQIPITSQKITIENINNIAIVQKSNISSSNYITDINSLIPFTKNQMVIIEIQFNAVYTVNEIFISNYGGQKKSISAKEILITNSKGELIYTDTLLKNSFLHIEKTNNGCFIPIKRIYVNRKISILNINNISGKNKNNQMTRVNSIDSLRKNAISEENKNSFRISKSKTLTTIIPPEQKYYVTCDKIKLIFLSNHGQSNHIGLTGIELYSFTELIQVETAKTIGAMPKDLNTYLQREDDDRIFENIFNGMNKEIDQNQMWLTYIDEEVQPYLEISFNESISLSKIKVYNFNDPYTLNKGVKQAQLLIYNNEELVTTYSFYLRPGIGQQGIDYSQDLLAPFKEQPLSKEVLSYYSNNKPYLNTIKYQLMKYYVPYCPCGFMLSIQLITNEGDLDYVGMKRIEIYDVLGNELINKTKRGRRVIFPKEEHLFTEGIIVPFIDLKRDIQVENGSRIYYFFNELVCFSHIKIDNLDIENEKRVKEIKVLVEDKIVFEGTMPLGVNEGYIVFTNEAMRSISKANLFVGNKTVIPSNEIMTIV